LQLPIFQRYESCTACELHTGTLNAGIPTRAWDGGITGKSKAVLLIGKHPGVEEDRQGVAHVGETGKKYINELYVGVVGLHEFADVYLTNAVRCKPANPAANIGLASLKACRSHLEMDLQVLQENYTEVVLLLCGAEAVKQWCKGKSFTNFPQGMEVEVNGKSVRLFATYHPAILLPGKDPAKASAVEIHLQYLREYLEKGVVPSCVAVSEAEVDYASIPPLDGLVSVDIETYGALTEQGYFHPRKSAHWDHATQESSVPLVVTVAVAWRSPDGSLRHRLYGVAELGEFREWVDRFRGDILGWNVPFDVTYLRAVGASITPTRHRLLDGRIFNFLACPDRPEGSLKRISPLNRVFDYDEETISLREGQRYESANDPALHRYNVIDAVATLRNVEVFRDEIVNRFGKDSVKLSDACVTWWSDLLWLCIRMMETGAQYDDTKLERLHQRQLIRQDRLLKGSLARGRKIGGVGSVTYCTNLATRCVQAFGLAGDRRLERSEKTGKVSVSNANIELFLGVAPRENSLRKELRTLVRYRRSVKLTGTYTGPMLGILPPPPQPKTKKNGELRAIPAKSLKAYATRVRRIRQNSLVKGIAYPTWFPVPTRLENQSGGTKQARLSCKGPALQTQPPPVESCQCSRFKGGALVSLDMRQHEMRVPVMFSNDPELRRIFAQNLNIYEEVGSNVLGRRVSKKTTPDDYAFSKMIMLAIQFRAGAKTLQEQGRKMFGLEVPLDDLKLAIPKLLRLFGVHVAWQDRMIELASQQGYLQLPGPLGITRHFPGGIQTVRKTYVSDICNFPIQGTAAALVESATVAFQAWLDQAEMRSVIFSNTHDEIRVDCTPDEIDVIAEVLPPTFKQPPLYHQLAAAGMFPVNLDTEVTITRGDFHAA
jgi:uracil-DNA glycosylase family 4